MVFTITCSNVGESHTELRKHTILFAMSLHKINHAVKYAHNVLTKVA